VTAARSSTVATSELRSALEHRLGVGVRELRRRPSLYSSSFVLEAVSVEFDDGTELELVLKDLSPSGMLDSSRGVKPPFLADPLREIETYRLILAGRMDTAECYAAVVDQREQRYWLLLEKVPGVELYQIGEIEIWQEVARWLAKLHVWGSNVLESTAAAAHLLRYTAHDYQRWMQRALTQTADRERLTEIRWLAERHDRVIEQLLSLPQTFIHGECYASNVLVRARPRLRVCPIDWEMAALGPGLMDVAALTAGSWTATERDQIAQSYHLALEQAAPGSLGTNSFTAALESCRFQLALQWLGWSEGWRPPREHATDWLDEALTAADKLGL
jgi:hypothetical protein